MPLHMRPAPHFLNGYKLDEICTKSSEVAHTYCRKYLVLDEDDPCIKRGDCKAYAGDTNSIDASGVTIGAGD